jgi:hypothetical protein
VAGIMASSFWGQSDLNVRNTLNVGCLFSSN